MGGTEFFNFAINPEHLLKISYISHKGSGKIQDLEDTYQRLDGEYRAALKRLEVDGGAGTGDGNGSGPEIVDRT